MNLAEIQNTLKKSSLDGWLFYDFRGSDPLAAKILQLDSARHQTRRWFYFIPAEGTPVKIVHSIEPKALEPLPGRTLLYLPWQELHGRLKEALTNVRRIAMQYSPNNAIPYISRVDAGTVELIKSLKVEVVSSADLVQHFEARLSEVQYHSHLYAAERISKLIDETFAEIENCINKNGAASEYEIQQFMTDGYQRHGLEADYPPIVAVGPNTADPHYMPDKNTSSPIRVDQLVLIDTWAKEKSPNGIYFDVTWTAYTGQKVPDRIKQIFEIVKTARDAAVSFISSAIKRGQPIFGWQVDQTARDVISAAGYGDYFIHRTGHSLHSEVHGNGANMDNLETRDERRLIPRTCFSIEPGIYLKDQFGIRSEVDVYLTDTDAMVTGRAAQTEIITLNCRC